MQLLLRFLLFQRQPAGWCLVSVEGEAAQEGNCLGSPQELLATRYAVYYSLLAYTMALDPKFGPAAQTPAARATVLVRMMRALPYLSKPLPAQVVALYQRYLAGELSWLQVYEAKMKLPTPRACKHPLPEVL